MFQQREFNREKKGNWTRLEDKTTRGWVCTLKREKGDRCYWVPQAEVRTNMGLPGGNLNYRAPAEEAGGYTGDWGAWGGGRHYSLIPQSTCSVSHWRKAVRTSPEGGERRQCPCLPHWAGIFYWLWTHLSKRWNIPLLAITWFWSDGRNFHILRYGEVILAYTYVGLNFMPNKSACVMVFQISIVHLL